jgi:phage protein D
MPDTAYQIAFDGEAAEDAFCGDMLDLTVEESTAAPGTLHLRLATTMQEDGAWSHLDQERLALFAPISVKVGFTGGEGLAGALGGLTGSGGNDGLEPVFTGYITDANFQLGSQPGESYLDLTAMDSCLLLSLNEKIAVWRNLSDCEIVKQIVGEYDLPIAADATPVTHQENDTTIMQRATDLQFVGELARRNGLEFFFETDKGSGKVSAYLRAPRLGGHPQPDLAIQFGEESNLVSFNARLTGQRPLTVKVTQTDVKSKSANTATADDTQLDKLGKHVLNDLVGGPLGSLVASAQLLVTGPPTSNATEQQAIVQAVRDEAGWFIEATGEINSHAYGAVLRPRRTVLVKGAGKQLSGTYYVTSVTHHLASNGDYAQRFTARRNARDLGGSEQFGANGLGVPIPGS